MEDLQEDTKPFEHVDAIKEEEETQPEPDEHLMMDQGSGRVWSVKVPRHLMEQWSAVDRDDAHLATIRVFDRDPVTGNQRIVLLVPPDSDPDGNDTPDEYELDMVNESVENAVVIAEREKAPGSRARTTILTGRVKHECNLRPLISDSYRRRMRHRTAKVTKRTRATKLVDQSGSGRSALNMLNSGISPSAAAFSTLVKTKQKPTKGAFERFARIPRNQLLDMLFALYRERPRWSAKELRGRTEQPEAYLKEVLLEIADLHRSGEFNGLYELKPNFKDTVKTETGNYTGAAAELMQNSANIIDDVEVIDDDDDDDDDDMEEVS